MVAVTSGTNPSPGPDPVASPGPGAQARASSSAPSQRRQERLRRAACRAAGKAGLGERRGHPALLIVEERRDGTPRPGRQARRVGGEHAAQATSARHR